MSLIGKVAQLELENTFTNKNIFNEEVVFDKSDGPPFSISNSTVIPGLNADMVDGLEGSAITGRLDDVENQIANIDVSWSGVTGKPSTFPPDSHTHTTSQITDFASHTHTTAQITNFSSHTHTSSQVGLGSVQNYGIATQAECDAASINNKYVTPLGLANLKQSVVNGKQAVVNAIDGILGYASGLTTNHPFSDYAWWIQNMIKTTAEKERKLYDSITQSSEVVSMSYTTLPYTTSDGPYWSRALEPGLYFYISMSWRGSTGYPAYLQGPITEVHINSRDIDSSIVDLPVAYKILSGKTYGLILVRSTTTLKGYDPNNNKIYDSEKCWYKINV